MNKIKSNVFFPMPVSLVGTVIEGKTNFLAVGWICRVNSQPPMLGIGISKSHYSVKGIIENKHFSVVFPDTSKVKETDYCGIFSGAKVAKDKIFKTVPGELPFSPLIPECPLNLECELRETIELPSNYLFIGEIKNAYCEEKFLENENPALGKMNLFLLSMPENKYWKVGEKIGNAWKDGKDLAD